MPRPSFPLLLGLVLGLGIPFLLVFYVLGSLLESYVLGGVLAVGIFAVAFLHARWTLLRRLEALRTRRAEGRKGG